MLLLFAGLVTYINDIESYFFRLSKEKKREMTVVSDVATTQTFLDSK